ncbi:uncharacterized protein K452DRAFT_355793 [Aplosporella prunicola CBS 121167]|uniref:Uncharacterized protein n=1 Tax=Aplosporella prunicola CBS 121167 TaxID=1176127 RepID=A0A6A6BQP2_9PEZI|nr:uncharacterized protein K452DRAFT_355793 [Aplosporella prunicola CBS 121167]KAF2146406.1 hypothetical protein K452DRAFT_355793 [Aplosporella prunicola CBS 121167]
MEPLPDDFVERRQNFTLRYQETVKKELGTDSSDLCTTAHSFIHIITLRASRSKPGTSIEFDLHDLWWTVIQAAKSTPFYSAEHDRMAMLILQARELGVIQQRPEEENKDNPVMYTSQGVIWRDLPFLLTDVYEEWKKAAELRTAEHENLASFIARLLAAGVCGSELAACALWTLRNVLEMSDGEENESESRLPVADERLAVVVRWLRYSGSKLLLLSESGFQIEGEQAEMARPGDLAVAAGVDGGQSGFSMARWAYWKRRGA